MQDTKNKIVGLSPMAGYTDSAFRQLVKSFCPDVKLVTELISADWLNYTSQRTQEMIKHEVNEKPLSVQLFWKHPHFFETAAKIAEKMWAAEIDINMWCPAKKVIHSWHWSALTLDPDLAYEIVKRTKDAVKIPVSVKMRAAWDRSKMTQKEVNEWLLKFCKWIEKAGAVHIVIHWRTVKQWYSWLADWEPIYYIKEHLNIPVFWNWDIKSPEDALEKVKNLDWIYVWRATVWDPWLCRRISQAFKWEKIDALPKWEERKKTLLLHMQLNIDTKWEKKWIREMRKHFAIYVKWLKNAKELRNLLVRVEKMEDVSPILEMWIENLDWEEIKLWNAFKVK